MIRDSFPALFSSCTTDQTQFCAAVNLDLQYIICIVSNSYAVKTPKDKVTGNAYWNF